MRPEISAFAATDQDGVFEVILPIQQVEFRIPITAAEHPDLREIPRFYQVGGSGFWVAKANRRVVGTLALKDIGGGQGALRKMFVAAHKFYERNGFREIAKAELPPSFPLVAVDTRFYVRHSSSSQA